MDGGAIATTTYVTPGSYTVRAMYRSLNGGALSPPQVAQARVRAADHPVAPFSLSMLRLRWEDGGTEAAVPQGAGPLVAYLDLKGEGTGTFLAQWTVDGVPVGTVTRQVSFAAAVTVDSRDLPSLPTTELGEHQVSLTADMRLSFGKDIAVLAPPQVLSPGQAVVRVYLSPTTRPGLRRVGVANPLGKARGPGTLQVMPREAR